MIVEFLEKVERISRSEELRVVLHEERAIVLDLEETPVIAGVLSLAILGILLRATT